ncbi:glycosyltransferase family 4 protein [Occultella aeris]|nr:glycosyltransferase family 4 protein [Occultella aeris]
MAVDLLERDLRRKVTEARADVLLEIQDLGAVETPFLVLQDLSYELLFERFGADFPHFHAIGSRRLDELRRRQEQIYAQASALLPMSQWLASSLQRHGIPVERIRVVNPAMNVPMDTDRPMPVRREGPCLRLLMVGRDFDRKGGPQVVAALNQLQKGWDRDVSLTVVGPSEWPMRGAVPAGVEFLGAQPANRIGPLMDAHDLFVMPSLFEGFGIVFAEALVRGLPCIGRDDCAMPEIIDRETGGRLIRTEEPGELADTIVAALTDDSLYEECGRLAQERAEHYSWGRAAQEVVDVAGRVDAGDAPSG